MRVGGEGKGCSGRSLMHRGRRAKGREGSHGPRMLILDGHRAEGKSQQSMGCSCGTKHRHWLNMAIVGTTVSPAP